MLQTQPLLVIVGETASGKTALALALAKKLGGEIICADSRTVYRGMDIGTAKPSPTEQAMVPHHLLDVVAPNEHFNAADFKRLATVVMKDIHKRDKLPIIVGGTGLYIDALLFNYKFRAPADAALRQALAGKSVTELQHLLREKDITLPENAKNPRHLIRALETGGQASTRAQLRSNTLVIGLRLDRDTLKERITKRVDNMVRQGLAGEVERLVEQYGWEAEALKTTSYRAFRDYLMGSISLAGAKQCFIKNDLALAKRQRTWFKRNKSIHWLDTPVNLADVVVLVTSRLDKSSS